MPELEYHLAACLDYNPQPFAKSDITAVLAVIDGTKDEAPWHWILSLSDGRFAYVTGWCDFTGWDCRSGADTIFAATPEEAANYHPRNDGRADLLSQLSTERRLTAREIVGRELYG